LGCPAAGMTHALSGRLDVAKQREDVDDLDERLGELLEDESSPTGDEEDPDGVFSRRKIFTEKTDPPVGSLRSAETAGELVLAPMFQRRKVWDDKRSSRLVESAILGVPLPVFYLAESPDGTQ
jgi:hypothetical protein